MKKQGTPGLHADRDVDILDSQYSRCKHLNIRAQHEGSHFAGAGYPDLYLRQGGDQADLHEHLSELRQIHPNRAILNAKPDTEEYIETR